MKKFKAIVALALTLVALMIVPVFAAATGTISGIPDSDVVLDQEFSVVITIDQDNANASGVVGHLTFDPEVVEFVDATPNDLVYNDDSTLAGFGEFTVAYVNPMPAQVTYTFNFKAIAAGDSDIEVGDIFVQVFEEEDQQVDFSGEEPGTSESPDPSLSPDPSQSLSPTPTPTISYNDEDDFSWIYDGSSKKPVPVENGNDGNDDVPATGDSSTMMWTYLALAALGVAGLGAMVAKKVFAK